MKRKALSLLYLSLFFILPNVVYADCMKVGYFDSFVITEYDDLVLYNGSVPVVKIAVDCTVLPTSTIRFLDDYVCDDDNILIDGSSCNIESLESAIQE